MEIGTYRRAVKALGYKLAVKTYSEFKACSYYTRTGDLVPTHCMDDRTYATHKALYDLRASVKGWLFDGDWRVVA